MTEYKRYQRTAIAEMVDWHENFDMAGVSVSEADQQAGSPKTGDKIARNPSNHSDRWLVAADYFANNFITIDDFGDAHRTGQEKRAAPELYEALEKIVEDDFKSGAPDHYQRTASARYAIAKARGKHS